MKFTSHKWISSEETKSGRSLVVGEKVATEVFGPAANSRCNLISIFGRARQGKSFLMNCLSGESEIFRVSNEKESCTQGIDISNKWLDLTQFSRIDAGRSVNGNIKVGFVDAEGQGDRSVTYDATLVCPILLASKCVIFNWKGDLQKDHILETLGIMTKAAKNVSVESNASSANSSKFAHLHIVFRDWQSAQSDSQSVYHMLFDLENNLESETRDRIRAEVMQSFATVHVWLFDAPTDSVQALKTRLTIDKTSFIFREQVRELRAALSEQLKEPTLFAGQPLTGRMLGPLISQVVNSLNRGEAVLPHSAYVNMMRVEVDQLRKKAEERLNLEMVTVLTSLDLFERTNGTGFKAGIFITTEADALSTCTAKLNEVVDEFEHELGLIAEGLSGSTARQVTSDSVQQLRQASSRISDDFKNQYRGVLSKWINHARNAAEVHVATTLGPMESFNRAVPEEDLRARCADCLSAAQHILGVSRYPGTEMSYANELLIRHYECWLNKVLLANSRRLERVEKQLKTLMTEALDEVNKSISQAAASLSRASRQGYDREALEEALNGLFEDKLGELLTQAGASSAEYADRVEIEFTQACVALRPVMREVYIRDRKEAFERTVITAERSLDQEMYQLVQLFTHNLSQQQHTPDSVDAHAKHSIAQAQLAATRIVSTAQRDISGWTVSPADVEEHLLDPLNIYIDRVVKELIEALDKQCVSWRLAHAAHEAERQSAEMEKQKLLQMESDRLESERLAQREAQAQAAQRLRRQRDKEEEEERENMRMRVVQDSDAPSPPDELRDGTAQSASKRRRTEISNSGAGALELSKEQQMEQAKRFFSSQQKKPIAGGASSAAAVSKAVKKGLKGSAALSESAGEQLEKAKQWAASNKLRPDEEQGKSRHTTSGAGGSPVPHSPAAKANVVEDARAAAARARDERKSAATAAVRASKSKAK